MITHLNDRGMCVLTLLDNVWFLHPSFKFSFHLKLKYAHGYKL